MQGIAAKIWGRRLERLLQFLSASIGHSFHVLEIVGGGNGVPGGT